MQMQAMDPPPQRKTQWWGTIPPARAPALQSGRTQEQPPKQIESVRLDAPSSASGPPFLLPLRVGSPWAKYEKRFKIKPGAHWVAVASRKIPSPIDQAVNNVAVGEVGHAKKNAHLAALSALTEATGFLPPIEIFDWENNLYVVFEWIPISLRHIIISRERPDEPQIACIMSQILNALRFLESRGMIHGALLDAAILMTDKGIIKIAHPESWLSPGDVACDNATDRRFLGVLMVQLMEKDAVRRPNGNLTLARPQDWSAEAGEFVGKAFSEPATTLCTGSDPSIRIAHFLRY